jgi:hypothetical protein
MGHERWKNILGYKQVAPMGQGVKLRFHAKARRRKVFKIVFLAPYAALRELYIMTLPDGWQY